tara:strand:- start:310 stop:573 length:264 start_codon:yes stop_codon:yes gene_type:complete
MINRHIILIFTPLLILCTAQPIWSYSTNKLQSLPINAENLPSALAEDDSFNELPFEQLRQALREEVERDPKKYHRPLSTKKYNLLIR